MSWSAGALRERPPGAPSRATYRSAAGVDLGQAFFASQRRTVPHAATQVHGIFLQSEAIAGRRQGASILRARKLHGTPEWPRRPSPKRLLVVLARLTGDVPLAFRPQKVQTRFEEASVITFSGPSRRPPRRAFMIPLMPWDERNRPRGPIRLFGFRQRLDH